MAATYTLATLRTAILRRVDHANADFFTTTWLNEEINNSAHKLHDLLIGILGQAYALRENVSAAEVGVADHLLPVDCYRLVALQGLTDVGWVPLHSYELQDRVIQTAATGQPEWVPKYHLIGIQGQQKRIKLDPPPSAPWCLKVTYHVLPPFYEADTDVIDIPWPEYVLLDVAVKCAHRQRKDATEIIAERTNLRAELESAHPPEDRANPPSVIDSTLRPVWPSALRLDATLLSDDELIEVPAARIRTAGTQSIVNGAVDVQVQLNAVEFADRDYFSVDEPSAGAIAAPTYAVTLRKTGYYLVTYEAIWGGNAGDATLQPLVSGAVLNSPAPLRLNVAAADAPSQGKSILIKGTAGQTIGLRATRSGGAASVALIAGLTVMQVTDAAKIKALVAQTVPSGFQQVLNLPAEELIVGSSVVPSTGSSSITVTETGVYAIVPEVFLDNTAAATGAVSVLIDDVALTDAFSISWTSLGADDQSLGRVLLVSLTAGQTVKLQGTALTANVAMTASLAVVKLPFDAAVQGSTVSQTVATGIQVNLNLTTTMLQSGDTVAGAANQITLTETGRYLVGYGAAVFTASDGVVSIEVLADSVPLPPLVLLQWQTHAVNASYGKTDVLTLSAGTVLKMRVFNGTVGNIDVVPALSVMRLP